LLAERGAAARPGFDPAQDPGASAEVCRRLDGLPLAIELAAARLRGMTIRQIADRLDGRFQLLSSGSRILMPRQQTLRAVVDWSWDLLAKDERALLRRLSVFAGGCTLEAAEQVCADDEVPAGEVAGLLLSLVDKSLVVADLDAEAGPARYRMLETIHEYAAERFRDAGESEVQQTQGRHLRCFREFVRRTEPLLHGPGQLDQLDRLEQEQDNIRAALRRALDTGAEQEALCLALGMSWSWSLRDYGREARTWLDAVTAMGPDPFDADPYAADPEGNAPAPLDAPPPWPAAVLLEARRQAVLFRLMAGLEDDFSTAPSEVLVERGRRIIAGYPPELPRSSRFPAPLRAVTAFMTGDLAQLPELMDAVVDGCRRLGEPWDLAFALQFRAKFGNDQAGGLPQSAADADEALALFERLGDRWGASEALSAKAEAAGKRGEFAVAAETYARAIRLAEELGAGHEVPILLVRQGEALLGAEPEKAERLIAEGVQRAVDRRQQNSGSIFFGRMLLLIVAVRRRDRERADEVLRLLDQSPAMVGPLGPPIVGGLVDCLRGWMECHFGEPLTGVPMVRQGIARVRGATRDSVWFTDFIVVTLLSLAAGGLSLLARRGTHPEAARLAAVLLGTHAARNKDAGNKLELMERHEAEQRLRAALGDTGYDAEYARGGRLTVEEAAALLDSWDPGESG
ncbi:ATP-binding protein, partial [Peterkaempfera griseoplana]|uniref:ATP-binding protein n=1 Tax=Peterkaempfera griseoplana TaxID=66896 RepID=UPI00099E63A1